jgi:hypothetical protein
MLYVKGIAPINKKSYLNLDNSVLFLIVIIKVYATLFIL